MTARLNIKVSLTIIILLTIGVVFAYVNIEAQSPSTINFQGKIVNKTDGTNLISGTPACVLVGADTCDFRVSLYDAASGGTLLWQETHSNVEIGDRDGIFSFELNSITADWAGGGAGSGVTWGDGVLKYIEIEFDDDGNGDFVSAEVFSRKKFESVPYAYYADSAGSVGGFTSGDFVQLQPGTVQTATGTDPLIYLNESGASSPNLIQLQVGGSDVFMVGNDGSVQINTTSNSALLNIGAALTSSAQIRLTSSAGVNPSAPNSGDLWWNGTELFFNDGVTNVDLLAGDPNAFVQGGNSFGATAVLGTNDNNRLSFETNGVTRLSIENDGRLRSAYTRTGSVPNSNLDLNRFTVNLNNATGSNYESFVFESIASGTNSSMTNVEAYNLVNSGASVATSRNYWGISLIYGTASEVYGIDLLLNSGGGNVTGNTYGLNIEASNGSGFNNYYGIFLGDVDATGNEYGLYLEGADTASIFVEDGLTRLAPATTTNASLNIPSGVNPTTPNSGDLWWNGTELFFNNGVTNVDLLAGDPNAFVQGGNSFGATAVLGTDDTNDLVLETDNTERIRIDVTGNVGIGTNTPSERLDVDGNIEVTQNILTATPSSSDPTYEWTNTQSGASDVQTWGVDRNSSGDVYAGGFFGGTVDFDPDGATTDNRTSAGSFDMFITKYDASGGYQWTVDMGSTGQDRLLSVAVDDTSGEVLVTGFFQGTVDFNPLGTTTNVTAGGIADKFVAKYDSSGILVWVNNVSGIVDVIPYAVAVDSAGNVYSAGDFSTTTDFDPGATTDSRNTNGNYDAYLTKYDSSGGYLWTRTYGGNLRDQARSITIDGNDDVIVGGYFQSTADFDLIGGPVNRTSNGVEDGYFIKHDSNGNFQFVNAFGSAGEERVNGIDTDPGNNIVITGHFENTVDFDPTAGILNRTSNGLDDIYTASYTSSGDIRWVNTVGDTDFDQSQSVSIDQNGNVYSVGNYGAGTVDFDPSAGTDNRVSSGNGDIFITKYDINGNYIWTRTAGDTNNDTAYAIDAESDSIYVVGFFELTTDFARDFVGSTDSKTSSGGDDGFVWKMSNPIIGSDIGTSTNSFANAFVENINSSVINSSSYNIGGLNVLSAGILGSSVKISSLTTVGALNSGSITSGFGNIDIGSSDLTANIINGNSLLLAASTTTSAQINLTPGANPVSPSSGDLWYNGTELNFNDGTNDVNLLAIADTDDVYEVVDTGASQTFTTSTITLSLDTEQYSHPNYSLASSQVTVNATGDYKITYTCSTNVSTGTARSTSSCFLTDDTNTEYLGTRCFMYNRTAGVGANSCSRTVVMSLTSGDIIRLRAQRTAGTDTIITINYGSGMVFEKIAQSGADYAERYISYDTDITAGEVISIDTDNDIAVTRSSKAYDELSFGIVSTSPAQLIGGKSGESTDRATLASVRGYLDNEDKIESGEAVVVPVALEGRVPLKVTLENGPIQKGDYLAASSKPGYAMKATESGNIIGRALEDFDGKTFAGLSEDELRSLREEARSSRDANLDQYLKQSEEGLIMVLVEKGQVFQSDSNALSFDNIINAQFGVAVFVISLIVISIWQYNKINKITKLLTKIEVRT